MSKPLGNQGYSIWVQFKIWSSIYFSKRSLAPNNSVPDIRHAHLQCKKMQSVLMWFTEHLRTKPHQRFHQIQKISTSLKWRFFPKLARSGMEGAFKTKGLNQYILLASRLSSIQAFPILNINSHNCMLTPWHLEELKVLKLNVTWLRADISIPGCWVNHSALTHGENKSEISKSN